jgi:hypothetical protein
MAARGSARRLHDLDIRDNLERLARADAYHRAQLERRIAERLGVIDPPSTVFHQPNTDVANVPRSESKVRFHKPVPAVYPHSPLGVGAHIPGGIRYDRSQWAKVDA